MRNKWILCAVLAMLFSLVLALPAVGAESNALIKAENLNNLVDSNSAVIIDIRDAEAYQAGHIPGAISVQTSEFYEDRDGVEKLAAGPEKFSQLLSNIGVTKDKQVIIYSAGNDLKHATRVWWVFHMYGHQNVQVLDGGIDFWKALGYELSTEEVTPSAAEYTVTESDVQKDTVATVEEVKAALNSNTIIVDCRNTDYFQGKVAKAARAGHIAGAILINASENLNDDMTFKNAAELAEMYAAYGITENTPVIVYCNTGTTASVHYFALTQILGYTNVQLFDASLMGWAEDSTLPMESNYDFFTVGSPTASVNTAKLNLSVAPFVIDGKSYVAAEVLAESLGAELTASNKDIVLSLDNNTFTVTDHIVKDNATFLPIRQVAEALGAVVGWDAENKQISVFLP